MFNARGMRDGENAAVIFAALRARPPVDHLRGTANRASAHREPQRLPRSNHASCNLLEACAMPARPQERDLVHLPPEPSARSASSLRSVFPVEDSATAPRLGASGLARSGAHTCEEAANA